MTIITTAEACLNCSMFLIHFWDLVAAKILATTMFIVSLFCYWNYKFIYLYCTEYIFVVCLDRLFQDQLLIDHYGYVVWELKQIYNVSDNLCVCECVSLLLLLTLPCIVCLFVCSCLTDILTNDGKFIEEEEENSCLVLLYKCEMYRELPCLSFIRLYCSILCVLFCLFCCPK